MSTIVAILPAEDAQIVMSALEAFIKSEDGKDSGVDGEPKSQSNEEKGFEKIYKRSMDMKRADALAAL
jgi:hypothetical protein